MAIYVKKICYTFVIVNIVATANVRQQIDLNALSMLPNISYAPDVYHCAYVKDQNMKGKSSIFATGKLISIGTKKEKDAIDDLGYVVKLLKKADVIKWAHINVEIQNIVVMVNLNKSINLTRLASNISSVMFEPEQFPGVIYKLDKPTGATALIFSSGKVILLGVKSSNSIDKLVKQVVELTREYGYSDTEE